MTSFWRYQNFHVFCFKTCGFTTYFEIKFFPSTWSTSKWYTKPRGLHMIRGSKVVFLGKIWLVQFLIDCVSMRKKAREMVFIPKDNLSIYFKVRQKIFVLCTHKAHLCAFFKNYDFRWKSLIFPSKLGVPQKLRVHQRGTQKCVEKKLHA